MTWVQPVIQGTMKQTTNIHLWLRLITKAQSLYNLWIRGASNDCIYFLTWFLIVAGSVSHSWQDTAGEQCCSVTVCDDVAISFRTAEESKTHSTIKPGTENILPSCILSLLRHWPLYHIELNSFFKNKQKKTIFFSPSCQKQNVLSAKSGATERSVNTHSGHKCSM